MPVITNKAKFAEIIGVSPREVARWIGAGMPAEVPGQKGVQVKIETAAAIEWLIERKVAEELGLDGSGNVVPMSQARRDLIEEQTRRLKLANDEKERELIPAAEVEEVMYGHATLYASLLDALAGRLAEGDSTKRERYFDECRRIRAETADKLQAYAQELEARCKS